MAPADLARVLRVAAAECERIESEQRAERRDWIDQARSPLGRRRHIAAARRLIATGDARACQVGRRYLLAPEALDETLRGVASEPREATHDVVDQLRERLGLRLVGGADT